MFEGGTASVYISDMDRAVQFYTSILGLKLINRIADEWAEVDAGNGFVIGLHPAKPPATPKPGTMGAINIELRVNESQSLQGIVDTLQLRGARFSAPIATYEHVRLATLVDLDGNKLLLAQTIPPAKNG